jgi:hypothetical protein
MTGRSKKLLLIAGILAVVAAIAIPVSISIYRKFNPFLVREVTGPVTLSTEWLEITPKEPLSPDREIQELQVVFTTAYERDNQTRQLHFPDGSPISIEVQLLDHDKNTYQLPVSLINNTEMGFSSRDASLHRDILPKDITYPTIQIRSNKKIECSKIIWSCYNPWDRK